MKQGSNSDEGGKRKRNRGDRLGVKEGRFRVGSSNLGRRGGIEIGAFHRLGK